MYLKEDSVEDAVLRRKVVAKNSFGRVVRCVCGVMKLQFKTWCRQFPAVEAFGSGRK